MQTTAVTMRIGAPSSTNAQGATGRISAAAAPSSSDGVEVNSAPRPAAAVTDAAVVAAPPSVATASNGTLMLVAPLGLQATVLSQPLFYPCLGEDMGDFAEEGDILFPVLGDPWQRVRRHTHDTKKEAASDDAPAATAAATTAELTTAGIAEDTNEDALDTSPSPSLAPSDTNTTITTTTTTAASTRPAMPQLTSTAGTSGIRYPLSSSLSSSSSTALCVRPVLTLPRKIGVSLAGETFRALLCFHNAAAYSLSQARLHVDVTQPQPPVSPRRSLLRRTVPTLPPKSNYTLVAAVPLGAAGAHSLAVTVDYTDPSGQKRQLSWNSTLKTEQPMMEVQPRRLTFLTPAIPKATLQLRRPGPESLAAYARYQLTVGLKNMSSAALIMTSSELLLPTLTYHDGKPLFRHLSPAASPSNGATTTTMSTAAPPEAEPSPALLMPGDTQTLVFNVGVYKEELRHATVLHAQGGVATRLLSPRLTSFGQVQWTWCRENGETGTARSAPLRVEELVAEPDVVLQVVAVVPASSPASKPTTIAATQGEASGAVAAAAASGGGGGNGMSVTTTSAENPPLSAFAEEPSSPAPAAAVASPPGLLLAGSPVTLHFSLANYSSLHRYDVALKVRVERLAPQWLYTGPTVRPLGPLESAGTLNFSVTLLPWQAGWLSVAQSALEVVDARTPDAVLWSPSSTALLQPVERQSVSMSSSGLQTASTEAKDGGDRPTFVASLSSVTQSAMKVSLPADGGVLCEVLVL